MNQVLAIFKKEWTSELRSRHGLFSSALFGFLAVVTISIASYGRIPSPSLAAGLINICLLFSSIMIVPRTFLLEEDQKTFDLLRMLSKPAVIFFGKTLYNFAISLTSTLFLSLLFSLLTNLSIHHYGLFLTALVTENLALTFAISFCSTLTFKAYNRLALTSILGLALLLPQVFLCANVFRVSFGDGSLASGVQNLLGLFGFALSLLGLSPVLVEALWKND